MRRRQTCATGTAEEDAFAVARLRRRPGPRRRALFAGLRLAGWILFLFACSNLALSLATFRGDDPIGRLRYEFAVLHSSPPPGQRVSSEGFARVPRVVQTISTGPMARIASPSS